MFSIIAEGDAKKLANYLDGLGLEKLYEELCRTDSEGRTALHLAAASGNLAITSELLNRDMDINIRDKSNKTALDYAASHELIAALLRTRLSWQDLAGGKQKDIRFNRVVGLMENSFAAIQPGKNKDLVLLIGDTGSGKSTIINYLLGSRYEIKIGRLKGFYAHLKEGCEYAKTGTRTISTTLHPQVFVKPGMDFAYCDVAGFNDTRGEEVHVCAANSLQMLTQMAKRIKAIVVILELPGLNVGRGKPFKETVKTLGRILNELVDESISQSIFFAFTKAEGENLKDIIEGIKEISRELKTRSASQPLTDDDLALVSMLEMMEANQTNIFIPDITDTGISRTIIEKTLVKAPIQDRSNFDFLKQNDSQAVFNTLLSKLSFEFNMRFDRLGTIPNDIAVLNSRISKLNEDIVNWRIEIANKLNEIKTGADHEKLRASINSEKTKIESYRKQLLENSANIGSTHGDISKLEANISIYSSEDPVRIATLSWEHAPEYERTGARKYWIMGPRARELAEGNGSHSFYAESPAKIVYHELAPGLDFRDIKVDGNKFSASLIYQRAGSFLAWVNLYIAKKDLEENRQKVVEIRKNMSEVKNRLDNYEKDRNKYQNQLKMSEGEVNAAQSELLKVEIDTAIRDERLKFEIAKREELILQTQSEIQQISIQIDAFIAESKNVKNELDVNVGLFNVLDKMISTLAIAGPAIKDFKDKYSIYCKFDDADTSAGPKPAQLFYDKPANAGAGVAPSLS